MATRLKRRALPPHVKSVEAKGKLYYYFDTGRLKPNGKKLLKRLPDIKDKAGFGGSYAGFMAHRARLSGDPVAATTVSIMIDRYQKSPDFARLAQNTRDQYNVYLTVIDRAIGVAPVGDVTRSTIHDLLDKMADRPGAANATLRTARALWTWGKKRELVSINPASEIDLHAAKDYEPWPEHLVAEAFEDEDRRVRLAVGLGHHLVPSLRREGLENPPHGLRIVVSAIAARQQRMIVVGTAAEDQREPRVDRDLQLLLRLLLFDEEHAGANVRPAQAAHVADTLRGEVEHGLRKNAVNSLLEAGCSAAETAAVSGQSLSLVEHYAKRRATGKLAASAMGKLKGPERERENSGKLDQTEPF